MKKKTIALALVLVMVFGATMGGTFAYLTSQDTVVNTFTVGNVKINLDEAETDINGVATGKRTEEGNSYKLLPGQTYVKDPTVTVKAGSEDAYVRMIVSVSDMAKLTAAFPQEKNPEYYGEDNVFLLQNLVEGWDNGTWLFAGYENGEYEFRYADKVASSTSDTKLDALFDAVKVPDSIDNDSLAELNEVKITVVAHAIQAAGFNDAADAWDNGWDN